MTKKRPKGYFASVPPSLTTRASVRVPSASLGSRSTVPLPRSNVSVQSVKERRRRMTFLLGGITSRTKLMRRSSYAHRTTVRTRNAGGTDDRRRRSTGRPLLAGMCGTDLELIDASIDPAYVHYPLNIALAVPIFL